MGILDSFHVENKKYIWFLDALKMLADHTNDNTENVGAYLLNHEFEEHCPTYQKSITQKMHCVDDGFGVTSHKTWVLLDNAQKGMYDLPFPTSAEEDSYYWYKSDFFGFPAIKELGLQEVSDQSHNGTAAERTNKNIEPYIKALSLGDLFTVAEAGCFISKDDPTEVTSIIDNGDLNYTWHYKTHAQAVKTIQRAIEVGQLKQQEGLITRESLQAFLHKRGFTIAGFNDNLPAQDNNMGSHTVTLGQPDAAHYQRERDQYKQQAERLQVENQALQQRIAELEAQQASQIQAEPEPQMHTRTASSAAKIIGALAELNALDLTQPLGEANKTIRETLERLGSSLGKDTVGDWLKQAHDQLK